MPKILIIEDDQEMRQQMSQVLRFEDFVVVEAANGLNGVQAALASPPPDLILCDIMMPELDGFGVLRTLRDNPRTAMIPFIFLTALVSMQHRRQGMEEGADDYITKPFEPRALVASIRRRLEKRRRQIEETRRRAEEVSLAVAEAVPHEIAETLEQITSATRLLASLRSTSDAQVQGVHQAVEQATTRLRRIMRRMHLYGQLPQLYGNRFELGEKNAATASEVIAAMAREVCRRWNREHDLVLDVERATLPMRTTYAELITEELVENACKFSPEGTPISVGGKSLVGCWVLSVRDRGPGLDTTQIEGIGAFQQFWRGGAKPGGLGLGLALTQGVARVHGCEFTLECADGATSACVLFPVDQ